MQNYDILTNESRHGGGELKKNKITWGKNEPVQSRPPPLAQASPPPILEKENLQCKKMSNSKIQIIKIKKLVAKNSNVPISIFLQADCTKL